MLCLLKTDCIAGDKDMGFFCGCGMTAQGVLIIHSPSLLNLEATCNELSCHAVHFEVYSGLLRFDDPFLGPRFKPKSEPLSVYSSYRCVHLLISVSLSRFPSLVPALMPRTSCSFLFCLSFSVSLSTPMQLSLPRVTVLLFPFFPPLSPGNQTSGEECWVSTFPEKRTIWATQRPTMEPLCSLLPLLMLHTYRETYTALCTPFAFYTYCSLYILIKLFIL